MSNMLPDELIALGLHPQLKPLDKATVRSQLTFLDEESLNDIVRAAVFLLKRIRQYYEVIGYTGPYLTSFKSEIPEALGEMVHEDGVSWRTSYIGTNKYHWNDPNNVFNNVRFACAESALMLAKWEVLKEVPESDKALWHAKVIALKAIKDEGFTGVVWSNVRRRYKRVGFIRILDRLLNTIDSQKCILDRPFGNLVIAQ